MQDFSELIRQRFSVRAYKNQEVEKDKLLQVLDAGRMAPSAANFQPWHFIVVNDPQKRKEVCACYKGAWLSQAPLIIVVCSDKSQSWKRSFDGKDSSDIDTAIAVDHMTLMATELGLGTCWICNFNTRLCSELLKIPRQLEAVAILPLGYPAVDAPVKKRKPLSSISSANEFGNPFS